MHVYRQASLTVAIQIPNFEGECVLHVAARSAELDILVPLTTYLSRAQMPEDDAIDLFAVQVRASPAAHGLSEHLQALKTGQTPLHIAAHGERVDIVRFFLSLWCVAALVLLSAMQMSIPTLPTARTSLGTRLFILYKTRRESVPVCWRQ